MESVRRPDPYKCLDVEKYVQLKECVLFRPLFQDMLMQFWVPNMKIFKDFNCKAMHCLSKGHKLNMKTIVFFPANCIRIKSLKHHYLKQVKRKALVMTDKLLLQGYNTNKCECARWQNHGVVSSVLQSQTF